MQVDVTLRPERTGERPWQPMTRTSSIFDRLRTPPLALRNVWTAPARSLIAIAGIGFATVMVLLQLGFLEAVRFTASINYEQLDFDVALVSPQFEQFYDPGTFPRERLRQAERSRWCRPPGRSGLG